MTQHAELLGRIAPVITFDYSYTERQQKRPDPLAQLIARHVEALRGGQKTYGDNVILVGKSMGGRVGCHLALTEPVLAVVCLGYPLVGTSKSSPLRDQVLLQLERPALFVQGTRDHLCPLPLLHQVLTRRRARSEVYVVDSGDHSLAPTKTHLRQANLSAADMDQRIFVAIEQFCATVAQHSPRDAQAT